jgi:PAS domain S-box-containing protein
LQGIDWEWLIDYPVQQNQIRYLNVSPGKYRFHVQAVNSLGIESPILSSGLITIKRPFYQTWWFYLLVLAVVVLLIFLTATYISRKRYAAHLEEEIHRRTRQLEESERELREIFNNAHDAILVLNPGNEVVYNANQRACEIYGFPLEEFIGMSLESITKDVQRGKEKIIETLQAGDCLSFETIQYRKDGSEMFLEVNASLINYRGKFAILSINRDITERKRAEQQIQNSLKEKEILLKEIHHRVKNNLQIVSSLLDLQADTLEDRKIIKVFQDSKNRVRSMALVHENLYSFGDLARIDGINYIHKLVENLFDTYGDVAENIASEVHIELPTFAVDMDTAIPLGLILTELITNALKHAFPAYREGEIQVGLQTMTPGTVTLTVRDNGVGLPVDIDLQESKTLGLQLISLLTQQLKGTLNLERKNGTTVTITFPYTDEPHPGL